MIGKKKTSLGELLRELYEQEVKRQEIWWSNYCDSIEYRFPAKIVNGRYFTLDGEIEIMDNNYIKWSEYECLSEEEKEYLKIIN